MMKHTNALIIPVLLLVAGVFVVPVMAERWDTPSLNDSELQKMPPPGIDPWMELQGRHPNVERNTEIMEYIRTCGLSSWYEERYNATCRYVYLVPGESCTQKMVYLNKDVNEREEYDSIVWVRLIDPDEELPIKGPDPDPLAGLYVMYPETRENPAIEAFASEYQPQWWGEVMENGTTIQVYLVSENITFRQLIATLEGETITGVTVLDETDLAVNKTTALASARQHVSPTAECIDTYTHLRLKDGRVVWIISYMDGLVYLSTQVDAGDVPVSGEKLPGFSFGAATSSFLVLRMVFLLRPPRLQ